MFNCFRYFIFVMVMFLFTFTPVRAESTETYQGVEYSGRAQQEFREVFLGVFGDNPVSLLCLSFATMNMSWDDFRANYGQLGDSGLAIMETDGMLGLDGVSLISPLIGLNMDVSIVPCTDESRMCGFGLVGYSYVDEVESFTHHPVWSNFSMIINHMIWLESQGYQFVRFTENGETVYIVWDTLVSQDSDDMWKVLFVVHETALDSPPYQHVNFEVTGEYDGDLSETF